MLRALCLRCMASGFEGLLSCYEALEGGNHEDKDVFPRAFLWWDPRVHVCLYVYTYACMDVCM